MTRREQDTAGDGGVMSTEVALQELGGTQCRCGQFKRRGMSHCRRCYYALPMGMRSALYRKIGHGYEEAYAESLTYLQQHPERRGDDV